MFSGIITDVSEVIDSQPQAHGLTLSIAKPPSWEDMAAGESVAVNGVCLTVTALTDSSFECQMVKETLSKTSFGRRVPRRVNLERALKVSERLSGHFVLGHIDETGLVEAMNRSGEDVRLRVSFDAHSQPLAVLKGSIAIDGVALTLSHVSKGGFEVALIPFTLDHTNLSDLKVGDPVNLEFDILGKYVVNALKGDK